MRGPSGLRGGLLQGGLFVCVGGRGLLPLGSSGSDMFIQRGSDHDALMNPLIAQPHHIHSLWPPTLSRPPRTTRYLRCRAGSSSR